MSTQAKDNMLQIYRIVLSMLTALGCWLANEVWTDVKSAKNSLHELQTAQAVATESKFTVKEANSMRAELVGLAVSNTQRITLMEERNREVMAMLNEINKAMKGRDGE